jgi:hypothetical protein
MDPVTISTAAVAFLSPYLVEGGKAVAKKAGETLWSALQKRFKGKPVPETALKDLKDDPKDLDNQAALRKELRKELKADADFLAQIAKLLEDAVAPVPPPWGQGRSRPAPAAWPWAGTWEAASPPAAGTSPAIPTTTRIERRGDPCKMRNTLAGATMVVLIGYRSCLGGKR